LQNSTSSHTPANNWPSHAPIPATNLDHKAVRQAGDMIHACAEGVESKWHSKSRPVAVAIGRPEQATDST
jgi:hypothetical protein